MRQPREQSYRLGPRDCKHLDHRGRLSSLVSLVTPVALAIFIVTLLRIHASACHDDEVADDN